MKAILEFTLPEEQDEHQVALDGGKWKSAVWDIDQKLRGIWKHGDDSTKASEVRKMLYEVLEDHGLKID